MREEVRPLYPVRLRPDAPEYAKRGPFWVGAREFVVNRKAERPLRGLIWYPALNPNGLPEKIDYTNHGIQLVKIADGVSTLSPGHALQDAELDLSKAPYPLVIYSHGYWGHPEMTASLSEHLASYGFAVMAPCHTGETDFPDFDKGGWKSFINRPLDVQRVIAYAENLTQRGDLNGLIDVGTIRAAGWSAGGWTALMAGGARLNLAAFEQWCADPQDDPEAQGMCSAILSHKKEMLALAQLDSMPMDLWPSWGDPRVKGIVAQSGGNYVCGPTGMASVTAPIMLQTGSLESVQTNVTMPYESASSTQKASVVFENANHMVFAAKPDDVPWLIPLVPDLYRALWQPVWDIDRAHDLINHFTTAFLLDVLKSGRDAHRALLPDAVKFPGIQYKTTLK